MDCGLKPRWQRAEGQHHLKDVSGVQRGVSHFSMKNGDNFISTAMKLKRGHIKIRVCFCFFETPALLLQFQSG